MFIRVQNCPGLRLTSKDAKLRHQITANCSSVGAASAVGPLLPGALEETGVGWGVGGQDEGGGRRLLHFISSKVFQYL